MDKKLEELIKDFGNATFDCGAFEDGTETWVSYDELFKKAEEAKKKLIEYITGKE